MSRSSAFATAPTDQAEFYYKQSTEFAIIMAASFYAPRIGSKIEDDGVKNVDVATHGSKGSVAFG
jgi:hypothetical protein